MARASDSTSEVRCSIPASDIHVRCSVDLGTCIGCTSSGCILSIHVLKFTFEPHFLNIYLDK